MEKVGLCQKIMMFTIYHKNDLLYKNYSLQKNNISKKHLKRFLMNDRSKIIKIVNQIYKLVICQ